MGPGRRRRVTNEKLDALADRLTDLERRVGGIRADLQSLDQLLRQLHTDSWNLAQQQHADMWAAQETRALNFAENVVLSMQPQLDSIRRELLALVGEKAVEVFREVSHGS